MKNKKIIAGSVLGIAVIILFIALFSKNTAITRQAVSSEDPIDIVLDFYGEWLDAVQSTSTDPYQLGLENEPILSKTLSDRLIATREDQGLDQVLCQNTPPTKVSSRTIFEETDTMQILVLSKEPKQAGQAVFALSRLGDGWYIEDILCSQGESDTPREFSFEHEGGLFNNITGQAERDQDYWSLLYTQDTKMYTARLNFTADSMCTDLAGTESVCDPSKFIESKVTIQGNMSESGVDVKQLTFIQ